MNYLTFKKKMFSQAYFNINQIYGWKQNFNRNNLTRWLNKGLIVKLRQGYYTFPEYKDKPYYAYFFANKIYQPSYISLHTALAFYGMIPESVIQITSVTTLKTEYFRNDFGEYSYKSLKKQLFFGYDLKPMTNNRILKIAKPEKALLDLLYLYPFYNTEQKLLDLRLNNNFLQEQLDKNILIKFCHTFKNDSLKIRLKRLFKVYEI